MPEITNRVTDKVTVTAEISTKNRYDMVAHAIMSVIHQTRKPERISIYDDTDLDKRIDLRSTPVWQHLFNLLQEKGILWEVVFGRGIGQVANHQLAIERCETTWIWRLDDDDVVEPDCLEKLLRNITPEVGAVSGLVLTPGDYNSAQIGSSDIHDIYTRPNLQWTRFSGPAREVDHFNNTFLFRREAAKHGYPKDLSPVGHREETIFTYEMKRSGWKLLVDPQAVTWHLRSPSGGIRSYENQQFWESDERIFAQKMAEWGICPVDYKVIIVDGGIGDHYAFRSILPQIKEKYKDKRLELAVCYPEVFADESDIHLISIADGEKLIGTKAQHCIYRWMWENGWQKSIVEAYKKRWLS